MPSSKAATPPPLKDQDLCPVELLAIADLHPHPHNDGRHPVEEIAHLKASIAAHGIYRNVVIAEEGTLLAGHGVVQAAQELGYTHIPGRRMPYGPDDSRAIQLLVGDNHIAGLRIQDDEVLAGLLKELAAEDPLLLLGTGFDAETLAQLLSEGGVVSPDTPLQQDATPPDEFQEYDESIPTEHTCPRCGFAWSGGM